MNGILSSLSLICQNPNLQSNYLNIFLLIIEVINLFIGGKKIPIKFGIFIQFFIVNDHTGFSSFNLYMIPNHKGWAICGLLDS